MRTNYGVITVKKLWNKLNFDLKYKPYSFVTEPCSFVTYTVMLVVFGFSTIRNNLFFSCSTVLNVLYYQMLGESFKITVILFFFSFSIENSMIDKPILLAYLVYSSNNDMNNFFDTLRIGWKNSLNIFFNNFITVNI